VNLGRAGVWLGSMANLPAAELRKAVIEIEAMGFGTIWIGEAVGREPFAACALILSSTSHVTVATGIANIWVRDATAMMNGARTLAEAWPNRFVLGIGVSHVPLVNARGHQYDRPLTAMRAYLEAMENAPYRPAMPNPPPPVLLAALGVKMLQLARERTAGAHPYFVPVEHTALARKELGPGPLLAVEQAAVLSTDPSVARTTARKYMKRYLPYENYSNNLRRLGWSDADFANDGSDALVDAIVVWGDAREIRTRVDKHVANGADHVCVQVLRADFAAHPLAEWRALAPTLL